VQPIYLVIGVPCSGKSWIASQLTNFHYVHHDGYIGHINQPKEYVFGILDALKTATKPILAEAPFSISQIKDPLEERGLKVIPVFILEHPKTLHERYMTRERKPIPKGHLTRQETYRKRAYESKAFFGTSSDVLKYLQSV
jgi:hypothetical protein